MLNKSFLIINILLTLYSTGPNWSVLFFINKENIFEKSLNKLKQININYNYELTIHNSLDTKNISLNNRVILSIWDHCTENIDNSIFKIVEDINKRINKKIDIICLDYCYSANIKTLLELSNYANYIVCCQDYHFIDGFDYSFLERVFNSYHEIAQRIIFDTYQYYLQDDMYNLINFSLVKCDKLHLLKPFLKRYNCIKKTDLFNHLNKKLKTKNLLNIIKTDIILTHFYGDHYSESNGIYILD